MPPKQYNWDFFIAHAGPDKRTAEKLYDLLESKSRVFLDSRSLKYGDDWDIELRRAQRQSLVTVVLISKQTDDAYYQREEIAAAILLARENKEKHRVVPVFLNRKAQKNEGLPYGLTVKHGLTVSNKFPLTGIAEQLLDLLSQLAKNAKHGQPLVPKTPEKNSTTSSGTVQGFPEDLIDFEDQRHLFKGMITDSPAKRLMFIQAPGGRGKSSLLRMLACYCEQDGIPYCSIDSSGQPYDSPHFTLSRVICDQLGLSPRHLANALKSFSVYRSEDELDDPDTVSQILSGVTVTHDGLRQRYTKERLRNAFLDDLNELVEQKGVVVCLFDSFESLSAEEEEWLLEALLTPVARGKLQNVIVVTAGHRWPKVNTWEWEKNAHLINGLPLMKKEHIKIYAERVNINITDDEAAHYWRASGGGIPLYMAMVVHNVRT